jgi:hypothetical protein
LSISIAGKSGWEIAVTGQNLSNRTIRTYGAPAPVTLGSYGVMTEPPCSVTMQVRSYF